MEKIQKIKLYKQLHHIAIFNVLQDLSTNLVCLQNNILLSYIGQIYLSATIFTTTFTSLFSFTLSGFSFAILLLFNQYYGKNDIDSIKKIFSLSLKFSLLLGGIFFILSFVFPFQIMYIFTNNLELISIGAEYLHYISFYFLFKSLSNIYVLLFKTTNKQNVTTIINYITLALNFCINLILIFGFITHNPLKVKGAALATVISSFIELLLFYFYNQKYSIIKFSFKDIFQFDKFFTKEIIKYSYPSTFSNFLTYIAETFIITILGHMSIEIINAFSFIKIFNIIPNSYILSMCTSFEIIIGQELGKGNLKTSKEYGDECLKSSFKTSFYANLLLFISAIFGMMIKHIPFSDYSIHIYIIFLYILQNSICSTIYHISFAPLTAGGEVEYLKVSNVITTCFIILPIMYLLNYVFKLNNNIILPLLFTNYAIKLPFLYSHYKKYIWLRDLTKSKWLLSFEDCFIDKYKRNHNLTFKILISDFFSYRFENSSDFIFSLNENNLENTLKDLQNYIEKITQNKIIAYKFVLSMEEIFSYSLINKSNKQNELYSDIGVKIKNNKIRFVYYDNGIDLHDFLKDESNINTKMLVSIVDKLEYKRFKNLNKIIVRFNL